MEINSPLKPTMLYGVFHPDNPLDCLYVGVTSTTLKTREDAHWAAALRGKTNGKFPSWMRKHSSLRGSVIFRELSSFKTRGEALEAEIREIHRLRGIGQARLNTTSGGDGQDKGYRHTAESKAKMSYPAEKNPTSKTNWNDVRSLRLEASDRYVPVPELSSKYGLCQNAVRNILSGTTWVDPEYSPAAWKRKFHVTPLEVADEVRSARMRGERPRELARKFGLSESTVRSIINNTSRKDESYKAESRPTLPAFGTKLTPEKVRRIREFHTEGHSLEQIAAEFGVTSANVSMIVRRKTWKDVR